MSDEQIDTWRADFGTQYTDRNPHTCPELEKLYEENYGVSRAELNERFVGGLNRDFRILEVGTNVGAQLACLKDMGFERLYGVEIQSYAITKARELHPDLKIVQANALNIPFDDNAFDMVFTSGVLIHIPPADLQQMLDEVCRCTRRYVWGFEYYASEHTEIDYRGNRDLLWKGDFVDQYRDGRDLSVLRREKIEYLDDENVDEMFLLERET